MAPLNNERVVEINFIFLSAVLTKESILFPSRVNFFFPFCHWIHNLTQSLFSSNFLLTYHFANFILFAYFFETGEPRLHKAFWFLLGSLATLQFQYVFLYCIIFWLNKNELNWTELNALLKFEISETRNCKRGTAVCGLRFAVYLMLKVSDNWTYRHR